VHPLPAFAVVRFAAAAVLLAAVGARPGADASLSRVHADQLAQKIAQIAVNGLSAQPASRNTTVTERELNSFLAFHVRSDLPPGVMDPTVTIAPAGRLVGRAIVDLDAVRKAREAAGLSAPMLMTGRLPVQAAGILKTSNGVGRFELQEAWVSSIPIPRTLLQQIVAHYTRTPESPDGVDLNAPFELPSAIREIRTSQGAATIIQ
jgi:hypothetical protein